MEEIQKKTEEIVKRFKTKEKRAWTPEVIMLDLVEEVGELASAVIVEERFKPKKVKKSDLKDSVSDVLYSLVRLANHYDIDVKEEYMKMLDELHRRIDNKDFDFE